MMKIILLFLMLLSVQVSVLADSAKDDQDIKWESKSAQIQSSYGKIGKELGEGLGKATLILGALAAARLPARVLLRTNITKQLPLSQGLSRQIIKKHTLFAAVVFGLGLAHGLIFLLNRPWNTQMLIGSAMLGLLLLLGLTGLFIIRRPKNRTLFYRLHLCLLAIILCGIFIHTKYKWFASML